MDWDLKELKKSYGDISKKYKLPDFKEINNDFEIEKIDKEPENLLLAVRKVMMDKILHSLSFFELLINPVNAPRLYYNYLKNISEDKKEIETIYAGLGWLNIASFNLEIEHDEGSEAAAIKRIFDKWQELKPNFKKVFNNMERSLKSVNERKERGYFG